MTALKKNILLLFLVMALVLVAGTAFTGEQQKCDPGQSQMLPFLNQVGKKASNFKTLSTEFTQEKEMAMFKDKLVIKGRIYLQKPTKIAWHVDSPLRYSVLITDKFIRQWDEDTNQVQELSLTKNPVFQNVINQLTVWFSGEYGSLLETNDVKVAHCEPMTIEFKPRQNNIAKKIIKDITITFRADRTYLQELRIRELSGDVTTIRFNNTILNAPIENKYFEVKGHV